MSSEYTARINRVIDHIEANIDQPLSLEELARVASFSPFHFHRIFTAMVGETLHHYIQRLRLEKAATMLLANPKRAVIEVALDCGFSGSSTFARAFKDQFAMSATEWRNADRKECKDDRNHRQQVSNPAQEPDVSTKYLVGTTNKQEWRITMNKPSKLEARVEVKELAKMNVVYVRHIGPYQGDAALFESLWGKLMQWAGSRSLLRFPETQCLCVYHDNPEITAEDKLRTDICITVPEGTPVDGEIGTTTLAAGKYAMARFEINAEQYGDAWTAVYGGWLPESGYQPADGPCFELCHNDPKEHPEGKHIVDICIPVTPL
jgi:AraC family transcriptional regulator